MGISARRGRREQHAGEMHAGATQFALDRAACNTFKNEHARPTTQVNLNHFFLRLTLTVEPSLIVLRPFPPSSTATWPSSSLSSFLGLKPPLKYKKERQWCALEG